MITPSGPTCPAAAVPIAPKMPAPMTAPMASMIRSPAPNARRRPFGFSPSARSAAIGLREKKPDMIRGNWDWTGAGPPEIKRRRGRRSRPRRRHRSDEQRREHERDGAQQLDQHVERRARGVLERIADGVADDCRLVGVGPLAAVDAGLDVLLRVVPGAAAVVQEAG